VVLEYFVDCESAKCVTSVAIGNVITFEDVKL